MRKNNKIIITVFAIIIALMILIPKVQAKTINTLNVTESNGKINVSGTTEDGVLAVAIMVYDSTESNLITMQTTSVGSDNNYSDTITIASGTYVIKVADYDGGEYITKKVTEETKKEDEKTETNTITENTITNTDTTVENTATDTNTISVNPKTGDNIILFAIIFIIALTGLVGTVIINKKRTKNSK